MEDLAARIDPPDLDVAVEDILVLQNAGPISPLGMPEVGYLPIPKKLAKAGVNDIVRISDARMFGTAFGTIILHVTPGAELGGPLALVQNGDCIRLSSAAKTIDLQVTPEKLEHRRFTLTPASTRPQVYIERSITLRSYQLPRDATLISCCLTNFKIS